jgi:hypothetical protein
MTAKYTGSAFEQLAFPPGDLRGMRKRLATRVRHQIPFFRVFEPSTLTKSSA